MNALNWLACRRSIVIVVAYMLCSTIPNSHGDDLSRIKYNNPRASVDLGVGLWAWPLPMDWDDDGDYDLIVVCPDKPYNGVYFFENPSSTPESMPTFRPGVRLSRGMQNAQLSMVNGIPRVLTPGKEWTDFKGHGFNKSSTIFKKTNIHPNKVRANQWRYADLDGDGHLDLVVGVGDWTDYGWDNAYDAKGAWQRGPLRGYVYWMRNSEGDRTGKRNTSTPSSSYDAPVLLQSDGRPVEVYGMPSPNLADFDNDGDLDMICGEFLDGFSYFENSGDKHHPEFTASRRLSHRGQPLAMDLQMITPTAIDWDKDGDTDLIVGDEDGRVAFIENLGTFQNKTPVFKLPRYFKQEADEVKFGALVTPFSIDWDNDGDEDLICGNTAGYIGFIENLDGGNPPSWATPQYLRSTSGVIRIQAGPNGSIQGPAEAKWGYTTLTVADWDGDDLLDIICNSIWGKIVWFRNSGSALKPRLEDAQPIRVQWGDRPAQKPAWNWWSPTQNELATQWRTTPFVCNLNDDNLPDLVMLDHEGYLSYFERTKDRTGLQPGKRIFVDSKGQPLRLNSGVAGRSGRRKIAFVDWNLDGKLDLIVNSKSADYYENISSEKSQFVFAHRGPLSKKILAGHTTSPTFVDWNKDRIPDLLLGAEDGFLYWMKNPHKR